MRVYVPLRAAVEYTVDVEDPGDLAEVKERLLEKGPSGWSDAPDFNRVFASGYSRLVEEVTEEDVVEKD